MRRKIIHVTVNIMAFNFVVAVTVMMIRMILIMCFFMQSNIVFLVESSGRVNDHNLYKPSEACEINTIGCVLTHCSSMSLGINIL